MNHERKKTRAQDTVGTEWLEACHKAFGRSILAFAKISKGLGPILCHPNSTLSRCLLPLHDHHHFVIFASFCAEFPSCDGRASEATPFAMSAFRAPGPLGDRTLAINLD